MNAPKTPSPARLGALRIGKRGEAAAARMAVQRGWAIHARNLRLRAGEADIVCVQQGPDGLFGLVIEVKSTGSDRYEPGLRIDAKKRKRLWAIARELADQLDLVQVEVVAVICEIGPQSESLQWYTLEPW